MALTAVNVPQKKDRLGTVLKFASIGGSFVNPAIGAGIGAAAALRAPPNQQQPMQTVAPQAPPVQPNAMERRFEAIQGDPVPDLQQALAASQSSPQLQEFQKPLQESLRLAQQQQAQAVAPQQPRPRSFA